ncbi:signal recognition particle-docking protein FtsY [Ligilactobacillus faecis]|uniref:signal recognition particle-docking protein FtsY n=1 Tax=Ligilactobacillus faecis TaxID=762833 RepID=UPI0024683722|nr:signal recognition particle-docking protein FtsY [Ligilactobacillus faecis]WGN89221.1 signal recognition particle-docking protein FtsY [Ligilactobacillus faecis]
MGLFDRLRRAFSGEPAPEKEEQTKDEAKQTAELEETSSESDVTTLEQNKQQETEADEVTASVEETTELEVKEPVAKAQIEEASEETENKVTPEKEVKEPEPEIQVAEPTEEEVAPKLELTENETREETEEAKEVVQTEEVATTEANEDEEPLKETAETKRYDKGLAKSRKGFGAMLNSLLANFRSVDEDFFEELEETLIEADVGFETAMKISDELQEEVKLRNAKRKDDVSDAIIERLVDIYEAEGQDEDNTLHFAKEGPTVFLFVGVNGVGKTTTIGKLAHRYQKEGKKVLLAAGDTFRAGAIEQLAEWAKRVNVDIVTKPEKSDPAAVVYDAVVKAKKEDYDILLVDTAGRLQNKVNLMKELDKIKRVITREIPEAPQEVLLALDATTGQNALTQAKQFKEVTDVSGIVLTKLDGTARGGIVLAIRNELHLPVKLVGLGEKMDDLRDFSPEEFVYGLFKGLVTPQKA